MSYHPFGSVSLHGRAGRSVGACKSLFLFTLATLALSGGTCAFALTPTTTTLAVTSAGSAVTTVPALTVVTLTATVEAGTTPLTVGQVNFCDAAAAHCTDIHLLGTAQLTSAGTAVFKFRPGIGSHSYKAVFLGTKTYASSFSGDSALTVAGGKYPTTTTIAQSGTFGSYSLTATVTSRVNSSLLDSPSGTVSFLDTSNGDAVVGSASLGTGALVQNWVSSALPNYPLASTGNNVAVADLNGDGILDLVLTPYVDYANSAAGNSMTVFLGNGDGTFTQVADPGYIPISGGAVTAIADFNGDGIPDLAVAQLQPSPFVGVALGNGDGTFQSISLHSTMFQPTANGLYSAVVADFNGDGIPDLALQTGELSVLLGNGDGTFSQVAGNSYSRGFIASVAVGDFNGDGIPDLAQTYGDEDDLMTILLGNGDGTFTAEADLRLPSFPVYDPVPDSFQADLAEADFNGDGKADLAVSMFTGLAVLLGNGDGTFTVTSPVLSDGGDTSIVAGDFNGDGKADLARVNGVFSCSPGHCPTTVDIFLGNGNGTFTLSPQSPSIPVLPGNPGVGDFNGDGVQDIAVAVSPYGNTPHDSGTVLLSQPTLKATATASSISLPPDSTTHYVEASYPGDSNYDSSVSATTGLIAPAQVSPSANSLSFGSEPIGDSSVTQVVTLTNWGGTALTLVKIRLAGANASSFSSSNNCGASLAAGASCIIAARMVPTATGPIAANISLSDSLSPSPQNIISLSGTGITPAAASLSLSASSVAFGSEASGDSTPPRAVTVTNTSATATLYFKSIMLGGTNASEFATSNSCEGPRGGDLGGILPPGGSCRIGIRFIANSLGPAAAAITLIDNAPDSPQTIALSGTGITPAPASLSLTSTSLLFGTWTVGQSTATQLVTVSNTSTTAVVYFKSIVLGGTNASSFVAANTCEGPLGGDLGGTLSPGASCLIAVRFVPKAAGPANATITLIDNAPTSPQTITLTGTGQ